MICETGISPWQRSSHPLFPLLKYRSDAQIPRNWHMIVDALRSSPDFWIQPSRLIDFNENRNKGNSLTGTTDGKDDEKKKTVDGFYLRTDPFNPSREMRLRQVHMRLYNLPSDSVSLGKNKSN